VARLAGATPTASNNKAMTNLAIAAPLRRLGWPGLSAWPARRSSTITRGWAAPVGRAALHRGGLEIGWQYRESDNNFLLAAGYASGTATPHYPAPNVLAGGFSTADVWRHVDDGLCAVRQLCGRMAGRRAGAGLDRRHASTPPTTTPSPG
jgi:hypothetical protein